MNKIHNKSEVDPKTRLGENVTICAFAVIRADEGEISIGDNTNIQEHVTIHGSGVTIGDNVTVGHNAVVHGCKIGNNCLIGIGAIVLNDAEIGDNCILGAGTVITQGKKIPPNSLVLGVPGKIIRELTEDDKKLIKNSCRAYIDKELKDIDFKL